MFKWLSACVEALSRSGKWKTVRLRHLEREPFCQACRREDDLEVHHIHPVHAGGAELDHANLITLCHHCHFCLGHACNWLSWRPDVVYLAAHIRRAKVEKSVNPDRNSA